MARRRRGARQRARRGDLVFIEVENTDAAIALVEHLERIRRSDSPRVIVHTPDVKVRIGRSSRGRDLPISPV